VFPPASVELRLLIELYDLLLHGNHYPNKQRVHLKYLLLKVATCGSTITILPPIKFNVAPVPEVPKPKILVPEATELAATPASLPSTIISPPD
jgi:hypothetical protein